MESRHSRKNSVFVVEDTKSFARLLRDQLEVLGYEVLGIASSFEETIEKLEDLIPDIILMDVNLNSSMDGIDTALELKKNRNIPVIYITSEYDDETIRRAKITEPYGYLIKPFDIKDLHAALEIALKRLSLERTLLVSEKKYRSLFEDSKDAIFIVDSDARIVDCNRSMLDHFGYSITDISGISLNDLFASMDEVVSTYEHLERVSFIKDIEVRMKKSDGLEFYGLLSVSLIDSINGKGKIFQYIMKEITPIKERAFDEIRKSLIRVNEIMNGIIQAISLTVEVRDPYTSGHQKNVAEIAVLIAEEMGIDVDTIEGIRIAALMHDLGKISVPAEILSKPGRLSENEFNLVKNHPLTGYDILKPINFPWPVADIVRQHHERIDGSGYPDGLRGDDLLLEAKIIGVADVIEAMASHRPYRPSKGIDSAMEVLEEGKGVLFDGNIIDAFKRVLEGGRIDFNVDESDNKRIARNAAKDKNRKGVE